MKNVNMYENHYFSDLRLHVFTVCADCNVVNVLKNEISASTKHYYS